jgi:hypothetical protein
MTDFTPTDLQNENSFQVLLVLGHDDITPFVGEYYWKRRNWLILSHYLITLATLAAWVFIGVTQGSDLVRWLVVLGSAVLAFILLVPIHEAIHGIVYWLLGAKDIRFSVSLREFYAYAIANQFVADRRELTWIALAPFIILNTALIIASIIFPDYSFFLLGVLLIHVGGTSGDWAILNFFWVNRDKNVYTYDDADKRKSYFFQKNN